MGTSEDMGSHGGLGLLLVILCAYFVASKRLSHTAARKREHTEVLKQKQAWLKSRTLQAMMAPDGNKDKREEELQEFPQEILEIEEESELQQPLQAKYDSFLKDSKTDKVLPPASPS